MFTILLDFLPNFCFDLETNAPNTNKHNSFVFVVANGTIIGCKFQVLVEFHAMTVGSDQVEFSRTGVGVIDRYGNAAHVARGCFFPPSYDD